MQHIHGFNLLREQEINEIQSNAKLWQHEKTGAQLISLENTDENKVFGITFRTPPRDSTGVAHILEHSVLCGSRKYPVKEPFIELLKGSLQTFLNAMTFPDKTCYPLASQNVQDFYNLIDVYLDAVFYPRISRGIFEQEGWHYELNAPQEPLTRKGVVYNEMKGAYSSPDSLLYEYSQQSLFPDTTYGLDSGGHPEHIPELTYEQFLEFHRFYYHPSNARIFFYGDDDPQKRLEIINDYLNSFEAIDPQSDIALQAHFEQSKREIQTYAAEEGGDARIMLTKNWLLDPTTDPDLNIAWQVLEHILIGMSASPLRKALIDSGLGEDVTGAGLENELRQLFFSTGLKGIKPGDENKVESLITETLEHIVKDGLDPQTVEAGLNTVEFELRENNSGRLPRGLLLMLRSLTTWLYDSDPLALLAFEGPLQRLKKRIDSGERVFEEMIQKYLLQNQHQTSLILHPDFHLAAEKERKEAQELQRIKSELSAEEIQNLIARTRELQQMQEAPDPPEALAAIPRLKVRDLEPEIQSIPLQIWQEEPFKVLYHDIPTNGIIYLDLGMDLHHLPQKYLGYVPLFARCLLEMGTEKEDYVSLVQRISRKTGGIHPESFTSCLQDQSGSSIWLVMRGKSTLEHSKDLIQILEDIFLYPNFDDQERFRQILLEEKAKQEEMLVPAGHKVVDTRLRARYTEADWAEEHMNGLSYLLFLRYLVQLVETDWQQILDTLQEMRDILINRNCMRANATLDYSAWQEVKPVLNEFLFKLPEQDVQTKTWLGECSSGAEGLTLPAQVNYVGKACNLYEQGYSFHASSLVICRYLRTTWLWDQIRVQGGAYGAFSLFDRLSGVLSLISYRDPNLTRTLKIYDQTADFLENAELSDDEIEKAIVGAIGDMDKYLLPDAKGLTSMYRYLIGETDESRQKIREQILKTSKQDFRNFAAYLRKIKDNGFLAVLGSKANIDKAQEEGLALDHVFQVL